MTDSQPQNAESSPSGPAEDGRPMPLPLDPRELMRIRVRPAEFARICGCTRQSVSRWIKEGILTLQIDGKLDLQASLKAMLNTRDPARVRAGFLKQLFSEQEALVTAAAKVPELEAELQQAQQEVHRLADLARRFAAEADAGDLALEVAEQQFWDFAALVEENEVYFRATDGTEGWFALLNKLIEAAHPGPDARAAVQEGAGESQTLDPDLDLDHDPDHDPDLDLDLDLDHDQEQCV